MFTWFVDWTKANKGVVAAMLIVACLGGGFIAWAGCESTTTGLVPDANGVYPKVTRGELQAQVTFLDQSLAGQRADIDAIIAKYNAEIAAINAKVEAGQVDLDKQDAIKADILSQIGAVATSAASGNFNAGALVTPLLGIIAGIGGVAYGTGKKTEVTKLKAENAVLTRNTTVA